MIRTVKQMKGFDIEGPKSAIGTVKDVYFDDAAWSIKYLVADTGNWLAGRRILIPRLLLARPEWQKKRFVVPLEKSKLEKAPSVGADEPVSARHHREMYSYYGIQDHWAMSGAGPVPPTAVDPDAKAEGDPHLRSCNEVLGYSIAATDGDIGHAEDFVVDDTTWLIRGLVIDTRNWLPGGKKVVVPIPWLGAVDWKDASVSVALTRARVEEAPEFDPDRVLTRDLEKTLHEHFDRTGRER